MDHPEISLDAHHCNPKTTVQIASAAGLYITQVKKNQTVLLTQCQALSTLEKPLFFSKEDDKSHGRLVSQTTSLYSLKSMDLDDRWGASQLAIKKHWGVESNNWILEVTFNEKAVPTDHAP